MDIVLNTTFGNPNLPTVPRTGFSDSFDRPAADTLGVTDDGKPWDFFGFVPWKITTEGFASCVGAGLHAVVDALTPDGTIETVVGRQASEGADKRAGLVLRMVDRDNYIYLCPNTSNVLTLYVRENNASAMSRGISGETLVTGDTLTVEMIGNNFTIKRNGRTIHTETISYFNAATLHGLYGNGASDTEFDSIKFTPAG